MISYVLPVRWDDASGAAELGAYLASIADRCELVVVDGSPDVVRAAIAEHLPPGARHLSPDVSIGGAMGKVAGVITGVRAAGHEHVVIADDDVRYRPAELAAVTRLLAEHDLVRPQNYFEPLVWHARLDTARSLLNRVFNGDPSMPAADFPGTLAVRRSTFLAARAYDPDAMFENLELIRTIRAAGGSVASPLDLYVARRPPTTSHYLSQRVRQAYDDFALPLRLAAFLAIGPAAARATLRRGPRGLLGIAAGIAVAAEAGRRRAGGRRFFPATASALAPLWVAERSLSAWLAVWSRLRRGGVVYNGRVVPLAANSERTLRARLNSSSSERSRATDVAAASGALAASNRPSL